jgi:hypothetical protein
MSGNDSAPADKAASGAIAIKMQGMISLGYL